MQIITVDFEQPLYIIRNNVKITIQTFKNLEPGHVKFGVDAPKNIKIHREEVYNAIKNKQALT